MKEFNNIRKAGVFHLLHSMEISDRVSGEWLNPDIFCCRVSDGSSGAKMASAGAQLCAKNSIVYCRDNYTDDFSFEHMYDDFLAFLKQELHAEARKYGASPSDLDATITVVITDFARQCFFYITVGTERIFSVSTTGEIKMVCGDPQENSVVGGEYVTYGRHSLVGLKSIRIMTDGLFHRIYKGCEFKEPYRTYIAESDAQSIIDTVNESLFYDDATIVLMEL